MSSAAIANGGGIAAGSMVALNPSIAAAMVAGLYICSKIKPRL